MHRHEDAVEAGALEHRAVVRVDLRDAEIASAPPGSILVDVAAGDELADLAPFGKLADRGTRLGRVRDGEAEARVQVLGRVAAAADEADPDELTSRARSYAAGSSAAPG